MQTQRKNKRNTQRQMQRQMQTQIHTQLRTALPVPRPMISNAMDPEGRGSRSTVELQHRLGCTLA